MRLLKAGLGFKFTSIRLDPRKVLCYSTVSGMTHMRLASVIKSSSTMMQRKGVLLRLVRTLWWCLLGWLKELW